MEWMANIFKESGWELVTLESGWTIATFVSLNRGLIFGNFKELPKEFYLWTRPYERITQWDVIVFCPDGVDSANLKNRRYPGFQLWYWDTQRGNLFPFPPSGDQFVPNLLKQLAGGKITLPSKETQTKKYPQPIVTYIIIGINLIYFILMFFAGLSLLPNPFPGSTDQRVLIEFGAKVNTLIQAGEVWRLLTCTFIHIGIIHLAFNLYALYVLGPLTEESLGRLRFFIIYILSGLGGSIASFFFSPVLSAGASGAVFGLMGALLYYSYKHPKLWKTGLGMNLVVVILVNFGFGIVQPGIDNFAHLGGFITGLISCFILTKL